MNMDQLDRYSRRFAEALFRSYPEWRQLGRVEEDGTKQGYLVLKVPCPSGSDLDHPLLITTHNGEVTVGLDHYHMHFDWPAKEQDRFLDPILFIEALLSDDVAVVSYWRDGQWASSTAVPRDEEVEREPGLRVRVRSWRGTRDQDLDP